MTVSSFDEELAEHAARIGESRFSIEVAHSQMKMLQEQGTLVKVSFKGHSMFHMKATMEELGIPKSSATVRKRYEAGRKKLLPDELLGALRSLDTQIHKNLRVHSFEIEGWSPWRLVPFTAYPKWKEKQTDLEEQTAAMAEKIVGMYPQLLKEVTDDYASIAREAWNVIRSRDGEFVEPEDAFVARITAAVVAHFPTKDDILGGVLASYTNRMVVDADEYRRRELELQEQELVQQEKKLELSERDAAIRAMHQAELEHARGLIENMLPAKDQVRQQIMAPIAKAVHELLATIKERGYLPGRSAGKVKDLRSLYDLLAIESLPELEQALASLDSALEKPGMQINGSWSSYDVNSVADALTEIAQVTATDLRSDMIGMGDNEWGAIEID